VLGSNVRQRRPGDIGGVLRVRRSGGRSPGHGRATAIPGLVAPDKSYLHRRRPARELIAATRTTRRTAEPSPRADPHCDNGTERTECARHVWMIIVQDAAYDPAMATRDPRLAAAIAAARNGPGRREVATSTSPRPRRSQARRCQIPRSRRCGHPAADGWRAVRVNWSPRSPAWHGPFDPTEDRAGHDARVRDATPATRGAGPR
jgi:hypothetical protein